MQEISRSSLSLQRQHTAIEDAISGPQKDLAYVIDFKKEIRMMDELEAGKIYWAGKRCGERQAIRPPAFRSNLAESLGA